MGLKTRTKLYTYFHFMSVIGSMPHDMHSGCIRGGKQCMHLHIYLSSEVGSNVCTCTCLSHQRWEAMYAPGHLFAIRGGKQCMYLHMSLPSEVGSNICTCTYLSHQRWEAIYVPAHILAIRGGKQCMYLHIS